MNDKDLPNSLRLRKTITFRGEPDSVQYISKYVLNRTQFINRAIRLLINYIKNPELILIELKQMYPELYKKVGRKKFIN